MLSYSDVKPGAFIELDGEPYEVLDSHVFRKQQRKPVNQTKLKNLISGKVREHSFHQSDTVEEAEVGRRTLKYLYTKGEEVWLCNPEDPSDRHSVPNTIIENELKYTKVNENIEALIFNEEIIGFSIPIKVELEVTQAPPNIRGNTSAGGNKKVVTETGLEVTTPLFIEAGDIIEINTGTGDYISRVSK